jgi:nickel-dependent lactate racemase
MGARVNFVFNDGTNSAVVLYSHWGADIWEKDLAQAIRHAEPRRGDTSYFTRMVISYLIQNELLDETGYGIYAIDPRVTDAILFDEVVEIDLIKETVNGYSFDSMMIWQGV